MGLFTPLAIFLTLTDSSFTLKGYYVLLSRIRYRQEKRWAKDHFERSIEAIKNGNNEIALEALSIAKDFDH